MTTSGFGPTGGLRGDLGWARHPLRGGGEITAFGDSEVVAKDRLRSYLSHLENIHAEDAEPTYEMHITLRDEESTSVAHVRAGFNDEGGLRSLVQLAAMLSGGTPMRGTAGRIEDGRVVEALPDILEF